jgi:hypothetical protein
MHRLKVFLILTGLADWWGLIASGLTGLLTVLSILAFWPKWRDSQLARAWAENRRLKGIIKTMTIEEEIKSEIIQQLQDDKKKLETDLIIQHRELLDGIHRSENPKSTTG